MSPVQRSNVGAQAIVRVLVTIGAALTALLAARFLGTEGWGLYQYLGTFAELLAFLAGAGMSLYLPARLARGEPPEPVMAASLRLVALGSIAAALLLVLAVSLLDGRPLLIAGAGIAGMGLWATGSSEAMQAGLLGLRQSAKAIVPVMVGRALSVVGALGTLLAGAGFLGFLGSQIGGVAVTAALLRRRFSLGGAEGPPVAELGREAAPYALNRLFGAIYLMGDTVVLQHLVGEHAVGIYRAAVMVLSQLGMGVETVVAAAIPAMSAQAHDPERAGEVFTVPARTFLLFGLPIAVGGAMLAQPIVLLVFGADFAESALPMAILLGALPLRMMRSLCAAALTALGQQGARARGVAVAAALNIGANLVFIPGYGLMACVVLTVAADLFLLGWALLALRGRLRPRGLLGHGLRCALAAAGMGVAVALMPGQWPVILRIALGALAWLPLALALGAASLGDLRRLARL